MELFSRRRLAFPSTRLPNKFGYRLHCINATAHHYEPSHKGPYLATPTICYTKAVQVSEALSYLEGILSGIGTSVAAHTTCVHFQSKVLSQTKFEDFTTISRHAFSHFAVTKLFQFLTERKGVKLFTFDQQQQQQQWQQQQQQQQVLDTD